MLTQKRLKELLKYDPLTGNFTWLVSKGKAKKGNIAGSLTSTGYIRITIDNVEHLAHRLAFLYMTGKWPTEKVDHKQGITSDNRWTELREASNVQNGRNGKMLSNNTSGFRGVVWVKCRQRWRANARVEGVRRFLGYFLTAEAASESYETFTSKLYGEFHPKARG